MIPSWWDEHPHKWAVGHTTFEFSFSLPEPANSGNCSKTKKKQPGPPPQKSTASTCPGEASPKTRKLKLHTKPDSASVETKKRKRAEYARQRNQTPERKERARLLAQARQRKAKELGLCRNCNTPAIEGQIRCESCAERHRVSRRAYDRKRREAARQLCIREKHDTPGPVEKGPPPQPLETISYQRATPDLPPQTVLPEVSPYDTFHPNGNPCLR